MSIQDGGWDQVSPKAGRTSNLEREIDEKLEAGYNPGMKLPGTSGIYGIEHTESGRTYVGSTLNIRKRISEHLYGLRRDRHHCLYLQRAWNKYGELAFRVVILEACLPESVILSSREEFWMCHFKDKLFNSKKEGTRWGNHKMSDEHREAMRQRMKGNKRLLGKHYGKLNEATVLDVFTRFANGESRKSIARRHGICTEHIYCVIRRKVWWHIEIPNDILDRVKARLSGTQGPKKLSIQDVTEIKRRIVNGEGDSSIARDYGVTHANIRCIRNGKTFRYVDPASDTAA